MVVSEIEQSYESWKLGKVRAFIDLTGINPVCTDVAMGGSGP